MPPMATADTITLDLLIEEFVTLDAQAKAAKAKADAVKSQIETIAIEAGIKRHKVENVASMTICDGRKTDKIVSDTFKAKLELFMAKGRESGEVVVNQGAPYAMIRRVQS